MPLGKIPIDDGVASPKFIVTCGGNWDYGWGGDRYRDEKGNPIILHRSEFTIWTPLGSSRPAAAGACILPAPLVVDLLMYVRRMGM